MRRCHNCGAETEAEATACPSCGASLQSGSSHDHPQRRADNRGHQTDQQTGYDQQPAQRGRSDQQSAQRPSQSPGGAGQPPRQRGQQTRQAGGQQRGRQARQAGQQHGRQPHGAPPQETGRRDLLKYGLGGVVALAGGFFLFDSVLGGRGPAETVEQFYVAVDNGNRERANELIHSDSPMEDVSVLGTVFGSAIDITVEQTEVVEKSDDSATVRATLTVSSSGSSETSETDVELRTENGEWKIWSS